MDDGSDTAVSGLFQRADGGQQRTVTHGEVHADEFQGDGDGLAALEGSARRMAGVRLLQSVLRPRLVVQKDVNVAPMRKLSVPPLSGRLSFHTFRAAQVCY
jgi:hypothetical protein